MANPCGKKSSEHQFAHNAATMLHDVIQSPVAPTPSPVEQVSIDELSSPFSAQILELCDSELFDQKSLQKSQVVTSDSNCGCGDNYGSISIAQEIDQKTNSNSLVTTPATTSTSNTTTATSTTTANNRTSNLSIIFDAQEEMDSDISASIDFSSSPSLSLLPFITTLQEPFDFSSVEPQIPVGGGGHQNNAEGIHQYTADTVPAALFGPPLASIFEDDCCLSSVPSYYVPLNPSSPSCSFLSTGMVAYMTNGPINTALSGDTRTSDQMFNASILLGSELQPKDLEFQGENGDIFCPDSMQRAFNRTDLQVLTTESPHLVAGPCSATSLTPEISTLEDSTFKVGKLSAEQRKEKIQRYIKKRNQRNFSKKIKYACRKTLADSRPRVRGRFAKNDEFVETRRQASSNHEEYDGAVVVKEEDNMANSSDIFAHISGVNSFKCNYTIQSWT